MYRVKNNLTLLLLLLTLASFAVSSCSDKKEQHQSEVSPLHDSITTALSEMRYDEVMRIISEGEREAKNDIQLYDVKLLRGSAYYSFGKAKELSSLLDSIRPVMLRMERGNVDEKSLYLRYLHAKTAYFAQYSNAIDSAIYYGKQAKAFAVSIADERETIHAMSNLADIYRQKGDIADAIEEYDNGIRLNDSIHADSMLYMPMYSGMACAFNVLHNEKETNEYLDKMLSMSRWMTTIDSTAYFNQKGNSLYFAGKYQQSLNVFLQYDSLLQHHPEMSFDRIVCDVNLADDYIHLGQDDKVGGKLTDALAFFEKNGITAYIPYIHTLQILHLLNIHQTAAAQKLAMEYKEEIPVMNPDHRVARYKVMGLCMEKNGSNADAVRYYKAYDELNDSLRNAQTQVLASEIEHRYVHDAQLKQHLITLQKKDMKELRLYITLLVMIVALMVVIVSVISYVKHSKHRITAAMNKILFLRGEIIHNRLTPHFISNVLALGHNLTPDDIDSIILLIRETLAYGNNLTAPLEKELELSLHYIRVANLIHKGRIVVEQDIDDSLDLSSYDMPAMSLSTIVENAVKHGKNDANDELHIKISIHRFDSAIRVQVLNGGQLFDYSRHNDRSWHGLAMIQQMVELINRKHNAHIAFTMENAPEDKILSTITLIP